MKSYSSIIPYIASEPSASPDMASVHALVVHNTFKLEVESIVLELPSQKTCSARVDPMRVTSRNRDWPKVET